MIVTKLMLVSLLGLANAVPLAITGSKTFRIETAPVVAVAAAPVAPAPPPPPPPAPVKNVVQVPVVQLDKAQVVDGVNRATSSIVGIIGNIATAVGQIVTQTVGDIGRLAQSLPPPRIVQKTVPVPALPVIRKTVSVEPLPLPPPVTITKTIPVPTVQLHTVSKTIG